MLLAAAMRACGGLSGLRNTLIKWLDVALTVVAPPVVPQDVRRDGLPAVRPKQAPWQADACAVVLMSKLGLVHDGVLDGVKRDVIYAARSRALRELAKLLEEYES